MQGVSESSRLLATLSTGEDDSGKILDAARAVAEAMRGLLTAGIPEPKVHVYVHVRIGDAVLLCVCVCVRTCVCVRAYVCACVRAYNIASFPALLV